MVDEAKFRLYRRLVMEAERLAGDDAAKAIENAVNSVGIENLTTGSLRQLVAASISGATERRGLAASAAAKNFYDAEREDAGVDGEFEATAYGDVPASHVKRAANDVMKRHPLAGLDLLGLSADVSAQSQRLVHDRADATIVRNARSDPHHPMWAIVPNPGACGFCVIQGSNGWTYSDEGKANDARHPNCKCMVVCDHSAEPSLSGYDPDALNRAYQDAADVIGDDWEREWDALGESGQIAYAEAHTRNGHPLPLGQARDRFKTRRTVRMMDGISGHSKMHEDDARLYVRSSLQSKELVPKQLNHCEPKATEMGKGAVGYGDAERIAVERCGTGKIYVNYHPDPASPTGFKNQIKETVVAPEGIVGTYRSDDPEERDQPTTRFTIHYSRRGAHVVPSDPKPKE
jgi:hypothetical protein